MTVAQNQQKSTASHLSKWKQDLLTLDVASLSAEPHSNQSQLYIWDTQCLVKSEFHSGCSEEAFWNKSFFSQRALTPFTTTHIETQIFEEKLKQYLTEHQIPKDAKILDVGCSDGRATKMLLDLGFQHIVSTDIAHSPVQSLYHALSNEDRENVLLIVDDVNALPLLPNTFDMVIAWGLFTSTPDFSQSLNAVTSYLRPGGLLLNTEPILESVLSYALVRGDLNEFMREIQSSTRPTHWEDKDHRYTVFSYDEIEDLMASAPLDILVRDGISVLPSLVFGGVCQQQEITEIEKEQLNQAMLEFSRKSKNYFRQVLYFSRKRQLENF